MSKPTPAQHSDIEAPLHQKLQRQLVELVSTAITNNVAAESNGKLLLEAIHSLLETIEAGEGLTRFDLVDHRTNGDGRTQYSNVKVKLSYQDDGRTLKVFLTDAAILKGEDGH